MHIYLRLEKNVAKIGVRKIDLVFTNVVYCVNWTVAANKLNSITQNKQ